MNLGDGLLFEVENGKPKLILLSHGTEKNLPKLSCRPRAAHILSSRQLCCEKEVQSEEQPARRQAGRHREARSRAGGAAASSTPNTAAAGGRSSTLTSSNASKTRTNHTAECSVKAAPKVKSDRPKHNSNTQSSRTNGKAGRLQDTVTLVNDKAGLKDTLANGEAGLKENVVCLTNEQLQQILNATQASDSRQNPTDEQNTQGNQTDSQTGSSVNPTEGEGGDTAGPTGASQDKHNKSPGSLLSWLEEQNTASRAAADAKRAQWRRELDEQVALKQQQSWAPGKLQPEVDRDSVLSVQSSISHTEQPAAIGSNFRQGESLSAERREEQRRRWLEELDRQKEETTQRRRQEKLLQRQTEDCYHWAMHFDSLKKRPLVQASATSGLPPAPPVGPDRAEWEAAPSSSLSLGWEATSSCGVESVGRASVGTSSGFPNRASHLRTMTALLDPVQIEERERRRLKQLEHQRALAAQAEERRQQREQEEARRREQEAADERRVALEREKLQRQYQLEVQRERQRKNFQTAERELQGIKQQENTQLKSSSQDTSNLQETQKAGGKQQHCSPAMSELGTERHPGQCLEVGGAGGAGGAEEEEEVRSSVSQCKDAAVQTEPVSAEYQPHPSSLSPPHPHPPPAPPSGRRRAVRAGKENVCVPEPGGEGGDPYEAFARTDRSRRNKRRPEWNTQRPSRRFVPASERYPAVLQRNRQESRLRRQAELLALQDRACLSRTDPAPPPPPQQQEPHLNPVQTRTRATPSRKVESVTGGQRVPAAGSTERGRSPPVPALRHRQKALGSSSPPAPAPPPPPILELVPFFRTEEVINMDPLEPLSTPTPDTHTDAPQRPSSPLPPPRSSQRDALLRPGLLHNTHMYTQRQQEILRGLAQLRQVLLQEQRELEADNPLLKLRDDRLWSPLTTHRM